MLWSRREFIVVIPRFTASFATFSELINDERSRTFLTMEIGAGHREVAIFISWRWNGTKSTIASCKPWPTPWRLPSRPFDRTSFITIHGFMHLSPGHSSTDTRIKHVLGKSLAIWNSLHLRAHAHPLLRSRLNFPRFPICLTIWSRFSILGMVRGFHHPKPVHLMLRRSL